MLMYGCCLAWTMHSLLLIDDASNVCSIRDVSVAEFYFEFTSNVFPQTRLGEQKNLPRNHLEVVKHGCA